MKQITLSLFLLFSFVFGFSQNQQEEISEIKTHTTKSGQIIYDTIWKVLKVENKISGLTGENELDTSWVVSRKTNHKKTFYNPVSNGISKGTVSLSALIYNGEEPLLGLNSIRVSYFTSDNFMLGVGLSGVFDIDAEDFSSFSMNLFGRNYFGSGVKSKTFLEAGLETDFINEKFELGVGIGKTFFVGSNFGIDLGIGYKTDFEQSGKIVFGIGFQGFLSNRN
jgi:hypothetical protein